MDCISGLYLGSGLFCCCCCRFRRQFGSKEEEAGETVAQSARMVARRTAKSQCDQDLQREMVTEDTHSRGSDDQLVHHMRALEVDQREAMSAKLEPSQGGYI